MTKKELEKIINTALENYDFNWEEYEREDLERVLTDIQNENDTLCFDTISCDWHPIAIQIFTDVKVKDRSKKKTYFVYSVITSFEMLTPKDPKDFLEILWGEYKTALRIRKQFLSFN